jgi:ABC transport system ATP-binding/permease protein
VAPPPWNAPAPVWSAGAPPAAPVPSTDDDLAAGAEAAREEAAPEAPVEPVSPEPAPAPWRPPSPPAGSDVAATMVAPPPIDGGGSAEREPTTLMPAWQAPAAVPPIVPETMAMPARPVPATGAGPQGELTIESGPDAGHSHRAGDHALRLGRSPDNDVILRDPATSGHHARLERRGDQFWLVDLGSTNGTFVNGESIQEKQLNHGDRMTIGQNSVHFALIGA